MTPLTVILTTYNRLEYTKRTVESLLRTVPQARIVIYDSASTEAGMQEWLKSVGTPNVEVVFGAVNNGWGYAVNNTFYYMNLATPVVQGMEMLTYRDQWVLISNNDVEYHDGWFEKLVALYEKYLDVGLMAVWKHTNHGVLEDRGDLVVKDQMPAVGWLFQRSVLDQLGDFPEHGPCHTKGGNGEDVQVCIKVDKLGLKVAAPSEDVATHIDGY